MPSASATSEPYNPDNLLDRLTAVDGLEHHYDHLADRERRLLRGRLGISSGTVLSVGAGWHPGRHLFPAPDFQIVAVDSDPEPIAAIQRSGVADRAFVGAAGGLDELPDSSFDVILCRLVLHHIAFQGPLDRVFSEAARLLRTGGALVAIEPNLWHPVGLALAAANKTGLANLLHGTPDDIPLSPARLLAEATRRRARSGALRRHLRLAAAADPAATSAGATRHTRLASTRGPFRTHADADRPPPMTQTASPTQVPRTAAPPAVSPAGAATALIAAGIVAIAFVAKTGSQSTGTGLGANTWVQIILVAVGVVAAIALIVRGAPGPAYGRTVFLLFAAVAVLTAASILWSVAPDESWVEAGTNHLLSGGVRNRLGGGEAGAVAVAGAATGDRARQRRHQRLGTARQGAHLEPLRRVVRPAAGAVHVLERDRPRCRARPAGDDLARLTPRAARPSHGRWRFPGSF